MRSLADPNATEVILIPSLNVIKSVGIKHQSNWRGPRGSVWKKRRIINEYDAFFTKINWSALSFCTENLEI